MAVYFAPQRQQPWWAGILTQLATGQIDAMMERTKEAKVVEAQRGLAGMVSQLQKENPGMSGSDIMAHVMGDKNYARSGDMGNKLLQTAMTEADRRSAEAELAGLGGETAGMLKPLILGKKMGLDAKTVSDLLNPTLVQRNSNLGNRYLGQMVNPRTGQVVGDSLDAPIGIDPGTIAQLTQKGDQFNRELGYKRDRDAQEFGLKREELLDKKNKEDTTGYKMVQDVDGNWVALHPTLGAKQMGVRGSVKGQDNLNDLTRVSDKDLQDILATGNPDYTYAVEEETARRNLMANPYFDAEKLDSARENGLSFTEIWNAFQARQKK